MAEVVYALCAIASMACVVLLARSYVEGRARLVLWCLICFLGLALNNVILFIDKVVATDVDLSVWRNVPTALGVTALVYGLIWDSGE